MPVPLASLPHIPSPLACRFWWSSTAGRCPPRWRRSRRYLAWATRQPGKGEEACRVAGWCAGRSPVWPACSLPAATPPRPVGLTALTVVPLPCSVVMCQAFEQDAFPVDTHIHRLAQARAGALQRTGQAGPAKPTLLPRLSQRRACPPHRPALQLNCSASTTVASPACQLSRRPVPLRCPQRWGLTDGKSVEQTEADLKLLFPQPLWKDLHLQVMGAPRRLGPGPCRSRHAPTSVAAAAGRGPLGLVHARRRTPLQPRPSNLGACQPCWTPPPVQIIYLGREHCPAKSHDPVLCPVCSWAAVPPYNKAGASPQKAGGSKNGKAASSGGGSAAARKASVGKAVGKRAAAVSAPAAAKRSRNASADAQV